MRRALAFATTALLATSAAAADLTVYTYDSFVSEWGPGPKLEDAFEQRCDCDLAFETAADGVSILNRLRMEGETTDADVVLGLDNALMTVTREAGLVAEHGIDLSGLDDTLAWSDDTFVPFDYGYFAFVYDSERVAEPVTSLEALVDSQARVIYQDPRTSTPGQGLLLWMKRVYGDDAADAWARLAGHTVTVTSGWWEAYSLFLEGDADYVLSYHTSPAYHRVTEDEDRYRAARFTEGHVTQIEVAALSAYTRNTALGRDFLRFLVSPEAQRIIPVTNWMLPVIDGVDLPPAFDTLIEPERLDVDPQTVADRRRAWLREWRRAAAR